MSDNYRVIAREDDDDGARRELRVLSNGNYQAVHLLPRAGGGYHVRESISIQAWSCPSILWHGPGHQSRTACQRQDIHALGDEHYAEDVGWNRASRDWTGPEAFD